MLTVSRFSGFNNTAQQADPYYSSVSLLLHSDGANGGTVITDSSSAARAGTAVGNAQTSSTQVKYGNASLLFNGVGDYVSYSTNVALDVRAGAFTVEAWMWFAPGASGALFSRASAVGVTYEHVFAAGLTSFDVYYGVRGTNQAMFRFAWASTLSAQAWHHIVCQRDGSGNWAAYADGVIAPTYQIAPLAAALVFGAVTPGTYTNAIDFQGTTLTPSVGAGAPGIYFMNGHIDEMRLTKGVARYSGATFTPPQAPFPNF